jgi:DNA (cytosine-5)-methyltransferase 1
MRYLSVCSGIEAASVAWHHLGWEPVGFSEIEPFPSAVLAHRFPNVPNYGDMTTFEEWPIEPGTVDLLVGGTPCQSFSVAGLRKGLEDPRGNLMLTYLAIAARLRPKYLVWENVPGVLSSGGGRDFGTFLRALGQLGYGWCYRCLDAQYVRVGRWPRAVPQRRRRVFVVGCLGNWTAAAEVLALREGLQRNLEASGKARKGAAPDAEGGARGGCWPQRGRLRWVRQKWMLTTTPHTAVAGGTEATAPER